MNVACSLKSRTTRGHNPDFENHQPPDSRDVSKLQIQKDQMTKDMELEKRQTEIEKLKRKLETMEKAGQAGPAMPAPSPKKSNLGTPRMSPKKTGEQQGLGPRSVIQGLDLDATVNEFGLLETNEETGKQSKQQGDKPGNGKDDAEGGKKKTETSELETETQTQTQTQTQSVEIVIDFARIGRLMLTAGDMDIVCGGRLADNVNGNISCYLGITPQTQQSKKGFQG